MPTATRCREAEVCLVRVVLPGAAKQGIFPFSIAEFFDKGITMGSGQAPVKKYNEYLRDLIVNGRAKPSKIISHRIQIEQAPNANRGAHQSK